MEEKVVVLYLLMKVFVRIRLVRGVDEMVRLVDDGDESLILVIRIEFMCI